MTWFRVGTPLLPLVSDRCIALGVGVVRDNLLMWGIDFDVKSTLALRGLADA